MNILKSSPPNARFLSSLLALATGCTTIGGSVRGDFACRAPKGGCAPMSAIDAGAVAHMADADDRRADLAIVPTAPVAAASASNPTVALRTGERTLTILLPAHVDGDGVLHDAATVHAVVEAPRWTMAARTNSPDLARGFAPSSLRAGLAEAIAPATEGPGSSPARVPHPLIGVDAASPLPPGLMPSPSALAAARKGSPDPATWPVATAAPERTRGRKSHPAGHERGKARGRQDLGGCAGPCARGTADRADARDSRNTATSIDDAPAVGAPR